MEQGDKDAIITHPCFNIAIRVIYILFYETNLLLYFPFNLGDTTFELFHALPNPDILKVKVLIVESTYIDNEIRNGDDGITRARKRGHLHLQEIIDNEHLFAEVENIVLVHFSDKYSVGYIKKKVDEIVPESLRPKIHLGLVLKESKV